ncbi:hypothetical protein [Burkholderia cenocepacia]|uniref:hypothetical protein n=1 Tax=Burkholderia cenocepacia TaxID=95486 RepID=UPI0028653C69|nr:hypothetical protein [Burkholderia cenocepacia]MDR8054196.1 hypothetical protein [Burkholderia cenocepacia]MDR8064639.1 hypothetical protein [Burkholderia cenocepacia]
MDKETLAMLVEIETSADGNEAARRLLIDAGFVKKTKVAGGPVEEVWVKDDKTTPAA